MEVDNSYSSKGSIDVINPENQISEDENSEFENIPDPENQDLHAQTQFEFQGNDVQTDQAVINRLLSEEKENERKGKVNTKLLEEYLAKEAIKESTKIHQEEQFYDAVEKEVKEKSKAEAKVDLKAKSSTPSRRCGVCHSPTPTDVVFLDCLHAFCSQCFITNLEAENVKSDTTNFLCPQRGCRMKISDEIINNFLTQPNPVPIQATATASSNSFSVIFINEISFISNLISLIELI